MSSTETSEITKREIQVEVPAAEVARETETLIQKYQKLAKLPGFRKGHVPASIIRQRFGEEIKSDVVESLVPRHFRREAEKQNLIPVSQPRITDLHIHDGEPLRFKASFEVLPEIKVEGYKELRADRPEISVTDQEVEEALKNIQEGRAAYATVEGRALAEGDFAQASIDGHPKDEEGQPVHMDEVLIEIGGANTLPEFSEALRGATTGEERTFDVRYPDEFSDKRLAGKTVTYTVKVGAVKLKSLPELNDEFAKELGDNFSGIEDVKQQIREGMEAERKHNAEHSAKEKLLQDLVQRNDFAVPEALVEHQIDLRLERGMRALAAQGMRPEELKKMDFARLRDGQRDQAAQEVKSSLLLEKVADAENIQVGDEEIDREINALAQQSQQTPEAIRARLTRDGALDRIRTRIRNEKALNFLYDQSA